jgi:hypothetical protein
MATILMQAAFAAAVDAPGIMFQPVSGYPMILIPLSGLIYCEFPFFSQTIDGSSMLIP